MSYEGLLRSDQFQFAYKNGKRYDGRLMSVFVVLNNHSRNRFGITASRKASRRAVDRNRMKRLLREAIRAIEKQHLIQKSGYCDWVLNARRSLLEVGAPDVCQELEKITAKVSRELLAGSQS